VEYLKLLGFLFCPSSNILKNIVLWKLDLFLSSDEVVGHMYSVGYVERANLNHWTIYVSITTAIYTPEIQG
jgi:hypothetical protein